MSKQSTAVPVKEKLAWGVGGMAESLANNAIFTLVHPIYQIGIGISPVFIGYALSASRILDAITDPIIGNVSDNTRSRWGRRRPFIFAGAILMSLFFAFMWWPPLAWGHTGIFVYLAVTALLFYLAFTVFIIPYSGLGLEMAEDPAQRAQLFSYRVVPSFVVSLVFPWLYKLSLLGVFGNNEVEGVRWVGIGIAILILLTALPSALFCRERFAAHKQEHIGLKEAARHTLSDRPFQILMGAVFLVYVGLYIAMPVYSYINIFHVFGGDKEAAAKVAGVVGTVVALTQIGATPVIGWLTKWFDKKKVLMGGLVVSGCGYLGAWLLMTPSHPYLQLVPKLFGDVGLCTCWLLNGALVADICDEDELRTGRRREGMYSAVFAFMYKTAVGVVSLLGGFVLLWAGVEDKIVHLSQPTLERLRLVYTLVPAVCFLGAAALLTIYPLTVARVNAIREKLEAMRLPPPSEQTPNPTPPLGNNA